MVSKSQMNEVMPKYARPSRIPCAHKWVDRELAKSPSWCSVDLRDGNQALPMPMNPERKMEFFKLLLGIGFKDVEVAFPSASQDDFDFVRELVEGGRIPSGVRISVLTQAREHLIKRTVEALKGVESAIFHMYVPTSDLHGRIVFNRTRDDVMKLCVENTALAKAELAKAGMLEKVAFEFSPEEFTDTDLDFSLAICKAVKETWGPSAKKDFILNLPATVERRPPYHYADMIESFIERYPYMDETTDSIHAHNDQGCAVAATEMPTSREPNASKGPSSVTANARATSTSAPSR
jgi:2-isopropylmalate synthase